MNYTIEELIDVVQCELTISGSTPKLLPDVEINRIVESIAAPWFYRNYPYAIQKVYSFVDKRAMQIDRSTGYSYIQMDCRIQNVIWLYEIKSGHTFFQYGFSAPTLPLNAGIQSTPVVASYVTTIGELGVYKSIIDSMGDMLDQFTKFTVKYDYNENTNKLNILTKTCHNLIAECWQQIELESLYADPYFIKYVIGYAKMQLGNLMGRYDFTLPGGVKFNSADLVAQGKEAMTEIDEKISKMSNSAWFFMVKR